MLEKAFTVLHRLKLSYFSVKTENSLTVKLKSKQVELNENSANLFNFRWPVNGFVVNFNVDSGDDKGGHVGAVEGI